MEFFSVLRNRVSTRDFDAAPVSDDDIRKILAAALYAPVGMHRFDTLHISVIADASVLQRVRDAVVRATGDEHADPLHGAPLLFVVSTSQDGEIGALNVSCLIENMLLCATDLGLGNLYVRGAITECAKDGALVWAMKIPAGFRPVASVAVGHAARPVSERTRPKNNETKIDYV